MANIEFGDKNHTYTLNDIPSAIMERFDIRAREMFPDAGDNATIAALTEYIESMSKEDESALFLTGIPQDNRTRIERALHHIGLSLYGMISRIFLSGQDGRFHLINYNHESSEDDPGHVVIFMGYPDNMMDAAKQRAKDEYDITVEAAFSSILLSFAHREVKAFTQKEGSDE